MHIDNPFDATKICLFCKTIFVVKKHRKTSAKFCSQNCYSKFPKIGKKHSEQSKQKIKDALKKKFPNGRTHTEDFKKMMSRIHKGKKHALGFKQSKETIEKRFINLRGQKHWRWIKDRAKLKVSRVKAYDTQYKYWMFGVKNRDGWKCKIFNSDCSGRLEAHHILSWSEHPKLRYSLNNGITLCHAHHPRKRAEEKRLSPYFQSLVSVSK